MSTIVKKQNKLLYVALVSLFVNLVLLVVLVYVACVKTDFSGRFFAKMGLSSYSSIDLQHYYQFHCLEGWANTFEKMRVESDIVFFGNSITYESDFQKYFPKLRISNLGCNGDNLDDLIYRSFIIERFHPHKIFVLGGINGLVDISIEEFEKKYAILIEKIKKQSPNAELFLQSILPVNVNMEIGARYNGCQDKIKKANDIISLLAQKANCYYIDLYSAYEINDSLPRQYTRDGLHLYPDAYSRWAHVISPYLMDESNLNKKTP